MPIQYHENVRFIFLIQLIHLVGIRIARETNNLKMVRIDINELQLPNWSFNLSQEKKTRILFAHLFTQQRSR